MGSRQGHGSHGTTLCDDAGVRRRRLLLLLLPVVVVGAGVRLCSTTSPEGIAQSAAERDADSTAAALALYLDDAQDDAPTVDDAVASAFERARYRMPDEPVDLLRADGDHRRVEGSDAVVEVRVTGHVDAHLNSVRLFERTHPAATVVHCYRIGLAAWSHEETTAKRIHRLHGCPQRPAIAVPGARAGADLNEENEVLLRTVLLDIDGTSTREDVLARLGPVTREGLRVDATTGDGAVGVALATTHRRDACLLGRRAVDGTVEVWWPAGVLLAPGEAGCTASTAAHGGAQGSPH